MSRLNLATKMTFNRDELLSKLSANRDLHAKVVLEARTGYLEQAQKALSSRLKQLQEGKIVSLSFTLNPPVDMTSAYDTVIEMLQMSKDTTIELTASEFRCLVQDIWDWSDSFWASNSAYSVTASRRVSEEDLPVLSSR
jgi:hypothetical protein